MTSIAFVQYGSVGEAEEAIATMRGQFLEGRTLRVDMAINRTRPARSRVTNPPSTTLYVGNLPYDLQDQELHELLADFKKVGAVRVAVDRRTGQPRGYAHVDFHDIESAQAAMDTLSQRPVKGRNIRVDFSKPFMRNLTRDRTPPEDHE